MTKDDSQKWQNWMNKHLIIDTGESQLKADDIKGVIRDKLTNQPKKKPKKKKS